MELPVQSSRNEAEYDTTRRYRQTQSGGYTDMSLDVLRHVVRLVEWTVTRLAVVGRRLCDSGMYRIDGGYQFLTCIPTGHEHVTVCVRSLYDSSRQGLSS